MPWLPEPLSHAVRMVHLFPCIQSAHRRRQAGAMRIHWTGDDLGRSGNQKSTRDAAAENFGSVSRGECACCIAPPFRIHSRRIEAGRFIGMWFGRMTGFLYFGALSFMIGILAD